MSPNKVKMPEQDPNVRNKNFEEASLGVQSGLWGIIAKARLMIIQLISFVPYHVSIVINNRWHSYIDNLQPKLINSSISYFIINILFFVLMFYADNVI